MQAWSGVQQHVLPAEWLLSVMTMVLPAACMGCLMVRNQRSLTGGLAGNLYMTVLLHRIVTVHRGRKLPSLFMKRLLLLLLCMLAVLLCLVWLMRCMLLLSAVPWLCRLGRMRGMR